MAEERKGVFNFAGNDVTLLGPALKAGDKAPDFSLLAKDLTTVNLGASSGKARLLSVVPSLDTGVCAAQTKKFEEELAGIADSCQTYTISMDLPFAQKRFCGAENISLPTLSDHRDGNFGLAYGVLVKELRLLARSIFVIGKDDTIQYVQIVPKVGDHVDYDKAIAAAKSAAS